MVNVSKTGDSKFSLGGLPTMIINYLDNLSSIEKKKIQDQP